MDSMYHGFDVDGKDRIRLLQIDGTADDGIICISFAVFSMSSRPHYHALSYTWTNPLGLKQPGNPQHRIVSCNGHQFDVFPNLYDALATLADSNYRDQLFWIDAICINQHEAVEKSAQLLLMPCIYRCADSVIIYLGPSSDDTDPALALIKTVGKLRHQHRSSIRPSKLCDPAISSSLGSNGAQLQSWRSLARFFCRSYFRRAWIVPEVLNASAITTFCGNSELSWYDLVKISDLLSTSEWTNLFRDQSFVGEAYDAPQHDCPAKLRATRYQQYTGQNMLLYSLIRTRPYLCSDPRDKIFSLLSTSQVVDYKLSVSEVYTRAAKILLEQSEDLLMLAHVEGTNYSTLGDSAASWVPDWSFTRSLGLGITGYKRYFAAGDRVRHLKLDGNTLELKGELIAIVTSTGLTKEQIRAKHSLWSWLGLLDSMREHWPYIQSVYEVFWRVLVADTAPRCPAPPDVEVYFRAWLARHLQPHVETSTDAVQSLLNRLRSPRTIPQGSTAQLPAFGASSIVEHDVDRFESFFGHSIGTTSLKAGDHIYLVHGSRIPLLFRPQQGLSSEYKLVGGCYLHGAMHGEMIGQAATVDLRVV